MTRRRAQAALLACVVGASFVPALPVRAERVQSDLVLIREDDIVTEDLYAAGNSIQIDGTVQGDLVASAFEEIRISGRIEGSVTAIASTIVVTGEVVGSVRALTRQLVIEGDVGGDVFVAGLEVTVEPAAAVERDLLMWARVAESTGSVGRNLEGQMRVLRLGGTVRQDVDVSVARLTVLPTADVTGDLVYRSDSNADVDASALVGGTVIHERTLPLNVRLRGIRILIGILGVLSTLALGLSIVWATPDRCERAGRVVRRRPHVALGWGVGLVSIPVALLVVTLIVVDVSPPSAGLPLLAIFGPLVLAAFSLLLVALLAAPIPVGVAVGDTAISKRSVYARFVVGLLVLVALALVPYVGLVVVTLTAIIGLGAWMLSGDEAEAE